MPTSPTWMAYAGDGINCIDAVPIAIQRGTFCKAFLGQVRHEHRPWQSQRWRLSALVLQAWGSHDCPISAHADIEPRALCITHVARWAGLLRLCCESGPEGPGHRLSTGFPSLAGLLEAAANTSPRC